MTTEAERLLTLNNLLTDAERELAAVLLDLDAAYRREADLAAELIEARRAISEQQQQIEVHQHAAVLAMEAHRRQAAEIDRWRARVMGGVWVWETEGCAN